MADFCMEKLNCLVDLTCIAASADKEHWQVVPYYYISSQVSGEEVISDYKTLANYQFPDIYQQNYWTDAMK